MPKWHPLCIIITVTDYLFNGNDLYSFVVGLGGETYILLQVVRACWRDGSGSRWGLLAWRQFWKSAFELCELYDFKSNYFPIAHIHLITIWIHYMFTWIDLVTLKGLSQTVFQRHLCFNDITSYFVYNFKDLHYMLLLTVILEPSLD